MKKPTLLQTVAGRALAFAAIGMAALHPLPAQNAGQNQILQNKIDEQEVRVHTAAVVSQIQGLIDELAANGISGDDLKVLNATKAALTNLSGPEMDQVIASLQKAGQAPDATSSRQNAVTAYADQKGIILQFRQILTDYEQRQAAYELPVRFKELADRQTETLLTSASVARATAGKSAAELTGMQATTEQIARADQEAIGNDANLAEEQLKKAAQNTTDDDAKPMQQAQKDMESGVLQQALSQANDDLNAGQLLKAIQQQQIARDELRHIAQDLNPPASTVDALSDTAAALAKLIDDQKALLTETNTAAATTPPPTGLDDQQAALVDRTNSLQQDMQALSAPAAGLVKDAIDPMQVSRTNLAQTVTVFRFNRNAMGGWNGKASTNLTVAADSQQQAIDKLEEAQKQLQQQLADAQKAADDAAKDPVAKLQDLQKQIQTAMQQQQQLANQTAQATATNPPDPNATAQAQQQQSQLQQQANNLQQAAQPLSLPAAQALANAAAQMNQAQQDLNNPAQAAQAQTAQKAAQAALAQANQQVAQQIAQAQQQPPDPAALAAAANSLQQAQTSVSAALTAAAPPAANAATPPPPNMAQAAAALADAAKNTQAAAATPGLPPSAAAAVQQAQASIAQGQQQAAKGDAQGTASAAAAAEQDLAQAQASVAMAQAGMAGAVAAAPGQTPGPPMPGTTPSSMPPQDAMTGGSTQKGTLHDLDGNGKFVTVASRDRAAIEQTQQEKRPQEYAPMIDQYMKNLADQSSSAP
jgi:DNA repair exonuclease SbcCD ATPase subunit